MTEEKYTEEKYTEEMVTCKWCGEEIPLSEAVKETDMGYLCDTCVRAITSRGETLNIEQ